MFNKYKRVRVNYLPVQCLYITSITTLICIYFIFVYATALFHWKFKVWLFHNSVYVTYLVMRLYSVLNFNIYGIYIIYRVFTCFMVQGYYIPFFSRDLSINIVTIKIPVVQLLNSWKTCMKSVYQLLRILNHWNARVLLW